MVAYKPVTIIIHNSGEENSLPHALLFVGTNLSASAPKTKGIHTRFLQPMKTFQGRMGINQVAVPFSPEYQLKTRQDTCTSTCNHPCSSWSWSTLDQQATPELVPKNNNCAITCTHLFSGSQLNWNVIDVSKHYRIWLKITSMIQNDQAIIRNLFHTSLASNDTGGLNFRRI